LGVYSYYLNKILEKNRIEKAEKDDHSSLEYYILLQHILIIFLLLDFFFLEL